MSSSASCRADFYTFAICSYEFGGPVGVTAMMIGFPILMYYLWICCWFYDGQIVYPNSLEDIPKFLSQMWEHVRVVSCVIILPTALS